MLFNQTAVFYTEHCHTIHIYTLVNMYAFVEIKEKKLKSLLLHLKWHSWIVFKHIPRKWFSKIKWKYIMNLKYFATGDIYISLTNHKWWKQMHQKKGKFIKWFISCDLVTFVSIYLVLYFSNLNFFINKPYFRDLAKYAMIRRKLYALT